MILLTPLLILSVYQCICRTLYNSLSSHVNRPPLLNWKTMVSRQERNKILKTLGMTLTKDIHHPLISLIGTCNKVNMIRRNRSHQRHPLLIYPWRALLNYYECLYHKNEERHSRVRCRLSCIQGNPRMDKIYRIFTTRKSRKDLKEISHHCGSFLTFCIMKYTGKVK